MNEAGNKGICRLSLVAMRNKPVDDAEMVSQLLFGEHYAIIEVSKNVQWMQIEQYFDGQLGWIRADQHFPIADDYFNKINESDYKVCLDVVSNILFRKNNIAILLGSVLPIATNELFKMEEQLAFNGDAKSLSQKRDAEFLETVLKRFISSPLLWGGKSPFGIDISGLIQQSFKTAGYKLKRTLQEQARQGQLVTDISESQTGDVVFYGKEKTENAHIIIGPKEVVGIRGFVYREEAVLSDLKNINCIRRYIKT
jgi:hypothetical protein